MRVDPQEGALCKVCKRGMLRADGCDKVTVHIFANDKLVADLDPIRYGAETRYGVKWLAKATGRRCHDCGALPGNYHHPGCDVEECPNCHTQLLMCGGECGTMKEKP